MTKMVMAQDSKDECPEMAGLAKYNGCQDTDGDGISDYKDKCPEVVGISKTTGAQKKVKKIKNY